MFLSHKTLPIPTHKNQMFLTFIKAKKTVHIRYFFLLIWLGTEGVFCFLFCFTVISQLMDFIIKEVLMNNGNDPLTSMLFYKRKFAWPNRDFIVQLKASYPMQACAAGVK